MFHVKQSGGRLAERRICDYEGSTYRTDFWEGRGREYEDRAERVAIRAMLPPRGRRLVDVGAGFGRLADLYDGYDEVVLLDYSQSQLEYARQHLGDGRFVYVAADIYRLPLATASVDAAVMVRVLHHLEDVPAAFGQLARALAGGGAYVLEFANKRHLKNLLRWALRRGPNPRLREPLQFADLHFDFHPAWVQERLRGQGFDVKQRRSVSLFRVRLLKRLLPARFLAALDALQQRPLAWAYLAPSVLLQSTRQGVAPASLPARAELFCCPDCGAQPLQLADDGAHCDACGRLWPRINGVYVFK
jgi:SAM-dependent methyltransferase